MGHAAEHSSNNEALDKLAGLRERIKAARLEKLIANQLATEILPPEPTAPEPDFSDVASAIEADLATETIEVLHKPEVAQDDDRNQELMELQQQLQDKTDEVQRLMRELDTLKRAATSSPSSVNVEPNPTLQELLHLQTIMSEKFARLKQQNTSMELTISALKDRVCVAEEEKMLAQKRENSLLHKIVGLDQKVEEFRKKQLLFMEEKERNARTIAFLEQKVQAPSK